MKLVISNKEREVTKITLKKFIKLLRYGNNFFLYGPSGAGKTAAIRAYAKSVGKKLVVFSLSMELPENIGGVPYAETTAEGRTKYFRKLLDARISEIIENEGENVIIFFDELNQASPEVMNALYSICDVEPEQRNWAGYNLSKVQIIAAGNLDDGTDHTVYLTPPPTPLHNRFNIFELKPSMKDTAEFLQEKWNNKIPEVIKFINPMLEDQMPPRDIDNVLNSIYKCDPEDLVYMIASKTGDILAQELLDIKAKIVVIDPIEKLKRAKNLYKKFKEDGSLSWPAKNGGASRTLTTEAELKKALITDGGLTEEEVASIFKVKSKEV